MINKRVEFQEPNWGEIHEGTIIDEQVFNFYFFTCTRYRIRYQDSFGKKVTWVAKNDVLEILD